MKIIIKTLIFCLIPMVVLAQTKEVDSFYPDSDIRPSWYYHDSNLILSVHLLQDIFKETQDNFVVSPFSIYSAFTLLANGTNEEGEKILTKILGEHFKIQSLNNYFKDFASKKSANIELVNSIWGNAFKEEYIETVTKELLAEAKALPENTSVINKWVDEKTHNKIKELLSLGNTNPQGLYLINTVYFKDKWQETFFTNKTIKEDFTLLDGKTEKVFFIKDRREIGYYEDEDMQAVRLPYEHGDYIDFFLPKKEQNFNEFIERLRADKLSISFTTQDVELSLPRFSINYKGNFKQRFADWGLTPLFEYSDVFKKMVDPLISKDKVKIENIIQEVNISLTEEGTEASAATALIMQFGSALDLSVKKLKKKKPYFIFKANRPFVFMINEGLFIGVYTKGKSIKDK